MTVLMQQVDVGKALDLLTMFKEAGKEKIDVRTIMDEAAPKIKDYAALVEKLEQLAGNHGTCNVSEFSAWDEGASREPVAGWLTLSAPTAGSGSGRLCPACPEGFVALETSTDRSAARTAHKAEKTQGLEE